MYSRKKKFFTLILSSLFFGIISTQLAFAIQDGGDKQSKKGSLQWYINGPQKEWQEYDFQKYNKWFEKILDRRYDVLRKSAATASDILSIQKAIINGNKITTEIWNYGSISSAGNRVTDIVWEGLGYGYEFGPFISAEVEVPPQSHVDAFIARDEAGNPITDVNGNPVWHAIVISDGLRSSGPEISPDGREFWGVIPLAGNDQGVPYASPTSTRIPTNNDIDRDNDGKPDSWPEGWFNPNLRKYVWPGALRQGASNADQEVFFVVDDRFNREFEYFPFPSDSSQRGLGIEIEFRYYQWSNPLAEDIIFLVYRVTNKSAKDLNNVFFGMWGDPHIGGPDNYQDDLAFFDTNINMVYAWDADNRSDVAGRRPGYFGYKFLESPGNPDDGIDNDGDGMVDESQSNGLDDDGDWDPEKHDVGVDGVPNTGDRGEDDGVPTAGDQFDIRQPGEPNFEFTDLDESDQNGLTSFAGPPFSSTRIRDDDAVWRQFMQPGFFDTTSSAIAGDNVFLYGSGPISLPAGSSKRFSIALVIGEDFDDLTLNAETAQKIFESNYQFAKPPEKPTVTAVPSDRKVTLYWDDVAETQTFDPLAQVNDFEGYVIYRSTDPNFLDQQIITDANGSGFLFEPLKTVNGAAARFDLVNEYVGLSPIPYAQRGIHYNLGNNTGLRHSFVDSNNVINGQTYYYAVVSYDHGNESDTLQVPPSESSKTITVNPESNEVLLDINTIEVVPRVKTAGYVAGRVDEMGVMQEAGTGTGPLSVEVIDAEKLEEGNQFRIVFAENPTSYSVEDMSILTRSVTARLGEFSSLVEQNINPDTFVLTGESGSPVYTAGTDYELDAGAGVIKALVGGGIADGQTLHASYRYFPIVGSRLLNNEEANPVFDGLRLFVDEHPLELDASRSGWTSSSQSNFEVVVRPRNNQDQFKFPADYEIRFSADLVDSSSQPGRGYIKANFQVFDVTKGRMPSRQRIVITEGSASRDSLWNPGETVIILKGEEGLESTWEFTISEHPFLPPRAPAPGDIYFIATTRPFTDEDVFTFATHASSIDEEKATSQLDLITVVPNPYVVTNMIEPLDRQNPRDRGQRRLYFNHLPRNCTIRIFTIAGELVTTIEHDSSIDDGKAFWDLTTKDNFPVAYGVYIYHVDAEGLGEKIGRVAVIK